MRALSCREEERLSAIHSLGILDSPPEPQFDAVVAFVRKVRAKGQLSGRRNRRQTRYAPIDDRVGAA